MKDIHSDLGIVQAVAPQVLAATNTSDPVDLQGFDAAMVIFSLGAIVSAGDFTAKLQESDTTTGGDFTDVAAANLQGAALPAILLTATILKVGYVGGKRYIRTVITKNGGTSIAASATVVKGHAALAPVA